MTADPDSLSNLSAALRTIREMLNMDVVFISEFVEGTRTFRYVDARSADCPVRTGDAGPLDESYCVRVVDGRLPRRINDANLLPAALEIPATRELGVRAHLSVPIRLRNGKVFGTLCCFSLTTSAELRDEDEAALQSIADVIAAGIDRRGSFRAPGWMAAGH